jgi:outer membrane lipoprotein carrier protein
VAAHLNRLPLGRLALALLVVAGSPWLSAQSSDTPAAVAKALQERYQGIKDFSADFVHTYRGGLIRTQTRERGTVKVKKPGKMRWIYTNPEPKEFVSDGVKIYSHIPDDKQVLVSDVPPDDQAATPTLFLAGKGDIARDFTAAFIDSPVPGTLGLKLTPKRSEPEFEYFIVAAQQPGLQIRGLATHDRQGGDSVITFTNLKENQGISDKEFAFRIPKGVDVITNGTRN